MVGPFLLLSAAHAAAPTGWLDAADGTHIAGWASDADYGGAIAVHIYVDGVLVKGMAADSYRADVGAHAFDWVHEPFGAGEHDVVVYAIGVDGTGALDGNNPALSGTPARFDVGCAGLTGDPYAWCVGNPAYWEDRQSDTVYIGDDTVRVGLNTSYGGTLFQLYDDDWTSNLLMEHGGAAIQLSIWGYDPVGGTGWFALDSCDATPYASEAACLSGGHSSCVARAYSEGAHVANCGSVDPCVGWDAGAPWNPIQAQGSNCGWDSSANDVSGAGWVGSTAYRTTQDTPRHFTKSGSGVSGLQFAETVTAESGAVRIDYTITYAGGDTWCDHDQEIPALFTAQGVDDHFYWYDGDAPFADATSAVRSTYSPVNGALAFPGIDPYTSLPVLGTASERWWTACDASDDRCVTVATFADPVRHATLLADPGDGAYLTPMGNYHLYPGFSETWTVWVFPYRYDDVVEGRSVRAAIYDLAAGEGCTAEVDCNGIDEDCTGADRCAGGGDTGGGDTGGGGGGGDTGGGGSGGGGGGGGGGPRDTDPQDAGDTGGGKDTPGAGQVIGAEDGCGGCAASGGGAGATMLAGAVMLIGARRRREVVLAHPCAFGLPFAATQRRGTVQPFALGHDRYGGAGSRARASVTKVSARGK